MITNKATNFSPFYSFKIDNKYFLFDGGSGVLNEIKPIIAEILNLAQLYDLSVEDDCEEIIQILVMRYTKDKINDAIEVIKERNKNGFLAGKENVYDHFEKEYLLEEEKSFKGNLWLNVTHNCNLKCKYCFEQEGLYDETEQNMSLETAKKCMDYWFERINKDQYIYDIIFFGGEPLLNQKVIFYCVDYINNLLKDLKAIPRYNITTNGTLLNDAVLKLFKDNTFIVDISIDGLKRMHEKNIPFKSGESTFDTIISNIKKLNGMVTKLSAFVCLTKEDIPYFKQSVQWLWDQGIKNVYGTLVFGKNYIYEYEDYIEYQNQISELANMTFENIINDKPYFYTSFIENIKAIIKKKFTSNCYLFQNGVLIFSPTGNAYKCHRFVGDDRFKLGDIKKPELNLLKHTLKKEKIDKCMNCWYQLFCGDGCPYEHDVYNGNINTPSEHFCLKSKIMFQESLKLYARLQINHPDKLQLILRGGSNESKL